MVASRASVLFLAACEVALTSVLAVPLVRREDGGVGASFQYQGSSGPNLWPGFCQDVNPGQSPIDIRPGSADANDGALKASLQPMTGVKLRDTGHGLAFELPEGGQASTFVAAGQSETFQIKGFHIHTPSEHRFDGRYFDAEVHFVGESPSGKSSVMAVMFEVSEQPMPNNLVSVVAQQLPLNGKTADLPPFDLSSIEAATNNLTGFHTYVGSLTTPPCTTGVLWNVLDKSVPISIKEMLALRREQGYTARFVQVARDEQPVFTPPTKSAEKNAVAVDAPSAAPSPAGSQGVVGAVKGLAAETVASPAGTTECPKDTEGDLSSHRIAGIATEGKPAFGAQVIKSAESIPTDGGAAPTAMPEASPEGAPKIWQYSARSASAATNAEHANPGASTPVYGGTSPDGRHQGAEVSAETPDERNFSQAGAVILSAGSKEQPSCDCATGDAKAEDASFSDGGGVTEPRKSVSEPVGVSVPIGEDIPSVPTAVATTDSPTLEGGEQSAETDDSDATEPPASESTGPQAELDVPPEPAAGISAPPSVHSAMSPQSVDPAVLPPQPEESAGSSPDSQPEESAGSSPDSQPELPGEPGFTEESLPELTAEPVASTPVPEGLADPTETSVPAGLAAAFTPLGQTAVFLPPSTHAPSATATNPHPQDGHSAFNGEAPFGDSVPTQDIPAGQASLESVYPDVPPVAF